MRSGNTEFDQAIKIANNVLDRPEIDPDDDICVLARQFLRSIEREGGREPTESFDWSALQKLRKASSY